MEKEILATVVQFHRGQSETSATQLTETFTPGIKLNLFKKYNATGYFVTWGTGVRYQKVTVHTVTQSNNNSALQSWYTSIMVTSKIYFPFGLIHLTILQSLLTWDSGWLHRDTLHSQLTTHVWARLGTWRCTWNGNTQLQELRHYWKEVKTEVSLKQDV